MFSTGELKISGNFTASTVFCLFCFAVGSSVIKGGYAVAGLGLLTAIIYLKGISTIWCFPVFIGMLTTNLKASGFSSLYLYFGVLLFLFFIIKDKLIKNSKITDALIIAPVISMIIFLIYNITTGMDKNWLWGMLAYGPGSACATFIFIKLIGNADFKKLSPQILKSLISNSGCIVLSLAGSMAVIGLSGFGLPGMQGVKIMLFVMLLWIGRNEDASIGALSALVMGLVFFLSGFINPGMIGVLAVMGAAASLFGRMGRLYAAASIFAIDVIFGYTAGQGLIFMSHYQMAAASLINMVMPDGRVHAKDRYTINKGRKRYDKREWGAIRTIAIKNNLRDYSRSLLRVSRSLMRMREKYFKSESRHMIERAGFSYLLMELQPWQVDALYNICINLDKDKIIDSERIDAIIPKYTEGIDSFTRELNIVAKIETSDSGIDLLAVQFRSIGLKLNSWSAAADASLNKNDAVEKKLLNALSNQGVLSLLVEGSAANGYIISIITGEIKDYIIWEKINADISKILKKNMTMISKEKLTGEKLWTIKYREIEKYSLVIGVSRRACCDALISGDHYSFMSVEHGKYMLLLSDGMGVGEGAAGKSEAAVSLIEEFMQAGFEANQAIDIVNSSLLEGHKDEGFATIDMCLVDLLSGSGEFIKMGGATSYILRNGMVEAVDNPNLPMGILERLEKDRNRCILRHGDMIIMMTDGVMDAMGQRDYSRGASWVLKAIGAWKGKNPQEMCEYLMDLAMEASGEKPGDDMTILVAAVSQNE